MTTPVEVPINLDGQQYLTMSQQIIAQNQQMMGSITQLSSAGQVVQRAYGQLAPSNDHITRMGRFADAAASSRKELSGLYAAQASGGANAGKLTQGIQQLAQQIPIGQRGAANIVSTISELGIGSQGSEKKVLSLSKTIGQLQGAVGGNGPQLGAGLVQLERTFGDQGVDPKRVQATADSLTTVSHQLGASAQGTLDFANSIGPFTQAAGIGKTASLGIAAAFSRIGQDGSYAANTVGTLLQGINTAVQEGSPDLAKYANIVGTTADHFQRMFKANPAGTLTSLTQSLAQSGPQTTMQLQGLGLDSVRSQRALQALIQSGGLGESISTAVGAYNSGSTQRSSKAAYNNVEDNFTRAGAAALALAQNLGAPLLGPINLFAKTLAGITGGVSNVVGGVLHTRVGGDVANAALTLGGIGLVARRLSGPLGRAGLAGTVLGSQPVRAGLSGIALGRAGGDMEAAQASRLGRLAGFGLRPGTMSPLERQAERGDQRYFAQNWRGETIRRGGAAQSAFEAGLGYGNARGVRTPGGPGMLSRVRGAAMLPFEAAQFAFRSQSDMARQARLAMRGESNAMWNGPQGAGEAESVPTGAYRTFGMRTQDAWRSYRSGDMNSGQLTSELRASLRGLSTEVSASGSVFGSMRNAAAAFGSSMIQQARLFGTSTSLGGAVLGAAGRGVSRGAGALGRGLMNFMGGPIGVGITAGMVGYSMVNQAQAQTKSDRTEAKDYDIYGQLNAYREASGQTTLSPTSTTGSQLATNTGVSATASDASATSSFSVTDADVAQAQATRGKIVQNYGRGLGTQALAGRINNMNIKGLTPQDAQSVRVDLLRQGYSREQVNNVMGQVKPISTGAPSAAPTGTAATRDTLSSVVAGGNVPVNIKWAQDTSKLAWSELSGVDQVGFGMKLKPQAEGQLKSVRSAVDQLYQQQTGQYGEPFARQQEFQGINQIFSQGNSKSQNAYFLSQLGRNFSDLLTGKQTKIGINDLEGAGGNFIQALANKDPQFAKTLAGYQQANKGFSTTSGGLTAQQQLSPLGSQMQTIGGPLATYYDNRKAFTSGNTAAIAERNLDTPDGKARSATQSFLNDPQNLSKQTTAAEAQIAAAQKAGSSLAELAANANKAADTINDTSSAAYALSQKISELTQQRMANQAPFQSTGQQFAAQSQFATAEANTNINSPGGQQHRTEGQNKQEQLLGQAQDMMKSYLATEHQFQISSQRATEDYQKSVGDATFDFHRSQLYAAQDYYRQVGYTQSDYQRSSERSVVDFNTTRKRAEEDYLLSVFRAEQDYSTQMQRQQRDYQISMARGQEDFFTTRTRAIRDFNKQLGREIEDSARTLYDPYKRIQTQQVWDSRDLLVNMNQQNQAIKQQKGQLDQVRKMGISNQTIQALGLNDPANAQQLSQMVNDLLNDPKLVKQINATAAQRMSLGQILVTDPSNKDIARAKADFATSLADMEADYHKSVVRAQADMARTVADEEADFGRQLDRLAQDFSLSMTRANQDFQLTLARAAEDEAIALARMGDEYNISVNRANEQFATSMDRMARDYNLALQRMRQDVTLAEQEITGSFNDIWNAVSKTMKGEQVDWQGLMKTGLTDVLTYIQKNKGQFANAYQDLVGGDIQSLFPKGGTGGPGPKGDPFSALFSSLNSKMSGEWPVDNPTITQHYHQDGIHPGIDLAVGRGTPIHAALGGTVMLSGWDDGYGNAVIIDHGGGRSTLYGHQERTAVSEGQRVTGGQVIGWVDSTGNSTGDHLHFETRQDGQTQNPEETLPKWLATAGTGKQSPVYHGPFEFLINAAEALTLEAQVASSLLGGGMGSSGKGIVSGPQTGALQDYARKLLAKYGWSNQWNSFDAIEMQEAGWDITATNPSSGAYGLAQALPPSKYAQAGADWRTNGYTQLDWMMAYIGNRLPGGNPGFHDPDSAEAFHLSHGWYGNGGVFTGPKVIGIGERDTEVALPLNKHGISVMADAMRRAIGPDDIRAMLVAGHSSPVTYHYETHTTDAGTHIEGPITVQAQDPNEMLRKLSAQKTAARLTKTGSRST